MPRYMIFGKTFSGAFTLQYATDGTFESLTNETDLRTHDDIIGRIGRLPFEERLIPALRAKGVKVEKVADDLSFDRFWSQYNYKHGKKPRAQNLWASLKDSDKVLALNGIKPYDTWLGTTSTAKLYPETYLSQRRWENYITAPTTTQNKLFS